jgi:hypothetical protein
MELTRAIEKTLDGNAILFVGAGFAREAVNIQGGSLPTGNELAKHFADLCALPEGTSLEDAAEAYVEKFNEDALIQQIQSKFTVKEVKPFHRAVAALPWKRIYTTNYDNVLEVAYSLEEKRLTPVTAATNIYKIPKIDTLCVHLNGYVDRLDRSKIGSELKLTEASYLTASLAETEWAVLFRHDLRQAQSVFFLGYSLYDLDIKKLLVETDELKGKTFFINGEAPDEPTVRRASRFGTVQKQSIEQFSHAVQGVQNNYVPVKKEGVTILATKEYSIETKALKISDKHFIDLLLLGKRSYGLVSESLRAGQKYFLERYHTSEVFDLIDRGHRVIVVCANLGNGKSLFIEGLRLRALEKGYRVFSVREPGDDTNSELEAIATLQQKTLTTIENYNNWLDEIKLFRLNASANAVLILTARNAINDVVIDSLTDISRVEQNIPELNIDKLQKTEIDWFVETLDTYGLWSEKAGHSKSSKIRFITKNCKSEIHAILLKLLSSPYIGGKIELIAKALRRDTSNYNVLLSVQIITLLNYPVNIGMLADIWGIEAVSSAGFKKAPAVQELIDFKTQEVFLRSSAAAEYFLRNTADAATIVKVLVVMFERVYKGARIMPMYWHMFKDLMRFSSLQMILPEDNRKTAVVTYYEAIKNHVRCKNNPQFWLQYAIALLVANDLERSKFYFETAYSLAESMEGYDTFQIDNHYTLFLLVQAVNELEHDEALKNFREARIKISHQIQHERRHYTYRVATKYQDFLDRFEASLSATEIEEVVSAASTVLKRIDQLSKHIQSHKHIAKCRKAMHYVIDRGEKIIASK